MSVMGGFLASDAPVASNDTTSVDLRLDAGGAAEAAASDGTDGGEVLLSVSKFNVRSCFLATARGLT